MANYGFSTAIPYGDNFFEVESTQYLEWQDALEACGNDANAMEWATYNFLISIGYFVNAPKVEKVDKVDNEDELEKRLGEVINSPSLSDNPRIIGGEAREPAWTPSKILAERDKLLRERERMAKLKEEALSARIKNQQWLESQQKRTVDLNFYNEDGTKYTFWDWFQFYAVIAALLGFIFVLTRF